MSYDKIGFSVYKVFSIYYNSHYKLVHLVGLRCVQRYYKSTSEGSLMSKCPSCLLILARACSINLREEVERHVSEPS